MQAGRKSGRLVGCILGYEAVGEYLLIHVHMPKNLDSTADIFGQVKSIAQAFSVCNKVC